ncbi:MAG: DUF2809 domain-containing protein [Oscillospiraceae bacterium]|nr:DUF2809 domain-containing protein [Oscillospiraceae bacterium]
MNNNKKRRAVFLLLFFLLLAVEVVIALWVRDAFVRPYLGDVIAVWVLYCLARAVSPRKPRLLWVWVLCFAVLTEILQLINIAAILGLPQGGVLQIIIGGTFSVIDLLCYLVGCLTAAGLEYMAARRDCNNRKNGGNRSKNDTV